MTDIIIPIKNLSFAKMRLANVLTASMRADLVVAMLIDLLGVVSKLEHNQIWVVASNEAVFEVGRKFGAIPIRETGERGYNGAVSLGFEKLPEINNVAVLPGDVPLVTSDEIAALVAPSNDIAPTVRLAPAHDHLGTNGLFLSSKKLISPGFGHDSFNRYVNAVRCIGIEPVVLDTPCLANDIDTPRDLCSFASLYADGATGDFLRGLDIPLISDNLEKGAA